MNRHTAQDTLSQTRDDLIATLQSRALQTTQGTTVFLCDNHIMRDINQTTSQITGIGSLHGRISQTLTGTVSRDKVLQHRHTLLEV